MPVKQTVVVIKTKTKSKTKSNSGSNKKRGNQRRCPGCGRFV